MSQPEIALLVSTYQRPGHLRQALESIALQAGVAGRIEVVVSDDGSTDETPQLVDEFSKRVGFRVTFTTHPHTTFCLARCRNEGVRASMAPYLLFLDGDCVLPPDHLRTHLDLRRPGVVMAGDCCRLDEPLSRQVTPAMTGSADFLKRVPRQELRRLRKLDRASRFYNWMRHPTKPKLIGNNVGIWRSDYERVNGYDENFRGWGCEDDDLRFRLRAAGVRIESILRWTWTYHLWHPVDSTAPTNWRAGANVNYLLRPGRLTRCRNGLIKRALDEVAMRVVGEPAHAPAAPRNLPGKPAAEPEVEILFLPGAGQFSGRAECNVVVARDRQSARTRTARAAHLTIVAPDSDQPGQTIDWQPLEQALGAVA